MIRRTKLKAGPQMLSPLERKPLHTLILVMLRVCQFSAPKLQTVHAGEVFKLRQVPSPEDISLAEALVRLPTPQSS